MGGMCFQILRMSLALRLSHRQLFCPLYSRLSCVQSRSMAVMKPMTPEVNFN